MLVDVADDFFQPEIGKRLRELGIDPLCIDEVFLCIDSEADVVAPLDEIGAFNPFAAVFFGMSVYMNGNVFVSLRVISRGGYLFKCVKSYKFAPESEVGFDGRQAVDAESDVICIAVLRFLNKNVKSLSVNERIVGTNPNVRPRPITIDEATNLLQRSGDIKGDNKVVTKRLSVLGN